MSALQSATRAAGAALLARAWGAGGRRSVRGLVSTSTSEEVAVSISSAEVWPDSWPRPPLQRSATDQSTYSTQCQLKAHEGGEGDLTVRGISKLDEG